MVCYPFNSVNELKNNYYVPLDIVRLKFLNFRQKNGYDETGSTVTASFPWLSTCVRYRSTTTTVYGERNPPRRVLSVSSVLCRRPVCVKTWIIKIWKKPRHLSTWKSENLSTWQCSNGVMKESERRKKICLRTVGTLCDRIFGHIVHVGRFRVISKLRGVYRIKPILNKYQIKKYT